MKNCPILTKLGTHNMRYLTRKIEIFKIRDGDGRHLENHFFGHNSLTDCPISAKFCTRKQNGMPTTATTKTASFQNPKWRMAAIFKIVKSPLSQWKIVRFWWNLVHYIIYWTQLQSRDQKNEIFGIPDGGFPDGGNRHLEIRYFGHNSSTDRPHDKNCKFSKSKMADGRHF